MKSQMKRKGRVAGGLLLAIDAVGWRKGHPI